MRNANLMKRGLTSLVFLFGMIFALAQMTVTGSVQDAGGNPVAGATVKVVGNDAISATSDLEGNYALQVPATAAVNGQVSISVINNGETEMKTFAYAEGGSTDQVFTFNTGSKTKLADVVVVGYGGVKKQLATGAIDIVSSDKFNEGYVSNADQLIQGKVAGVQITSDGSPQGGAVIRIRGGSSLNASNDPLIIVDGLPLDTGTGVSFLNPNDIESVSILKDASATAIYGTRGANGVILYTTKKGSKGDWKYNYNAQFTLNTMPYSFNQLSGSEYRNLISNTNWSAYGLNDPSSNLGVWADPNNHSLGRVYYDTNWIDEIMGNTLSTMHSLSVNGNAFNRIPTRISGNYTSNPGMLMTSNYQREVLSLAMSPSFFDNSLKVNLTANTSHENFRFADAGQIGSALGFDPTKPVMYDGISFGNGFFEWTDTSGNYINLASANPVGVLSQTHNIQSQNRYFGNLELDYKFFFFKDLRAVVRGGFDQLIWNGNNNVDIGARSVTDNGNLIGRKERYNGLRENKSLDAYLVYKHDYNGWVTELTGGYAYQKLFSRNYNTGNVYSSSNPVHYVDYPYAENYTTVGFFGRFNLSVDEKYLLNVNYRYDGTSKFGEKYRWESFPGVSVGWVLSKEDFLKDNTLINNLKLRASFGRTGNQSVPSYGYLSLYYQGNSQSMYYFGNNAYLPIYPSYYNDNLRWETTSDWDLGFDYGLLDNKFSGSFDVYYKKTEDLLSFVNVAPGANFANQGWTNKGDFTTKGFEFLLNYKPIKTQDMDLGFSYNLSYNKREITSLGNGGQVAVGGINGLIGQNITYHEVGQSPNAFWVFEQVYDSNGKPMEGVFVDRNGDGLLNDNDRYYNKDPFPKFVMGLRTDFRYKSFDFAMNWRAHLGNYVYNNLAANNTFLSNIPSSSNFASNITSDYFDTNFIQKDVRTMQSDYFIENGSFVKLDNVTLGYNFSEVFGKGTSFKVSLSGNNLLIITDSKVKDPEVYDGIYYNLYPRARMYVVGLNFNF